MTLGTGRKKGGFTLLEILLTLGMASALTGLAWVSLSGILKRVETDFIIKKFEYEIGLSSYRAMVSRSPRIFTWGNQTLTFAKDGSVDPALFVLEGINRSELLIKVGKDGRHAISQKP